MISEITRIQELMGVNKKLIVENRWVDMFDTFMSDFVENNVKRLKGLADEVEVAGIQIKKTTLSEFRNVLNGLKKLDDLTPDSIKLFAQIMRQNKEIVSDIYEQLFQDFVRLGNVSEKQLIKSISDDMIAGEKIGDILTKMNGGNQDIFLNNILERKIGERVKEFRASLKPKGPEFVEVVSRPSSNTVKTLFRNVDFDNITPSQCFGYMKSILTSRKTILNFVRRGINENLNKKMSKLQTLSEEIDVIFADIKRTMPRISDDLQNIDNDRIVGEMRDISTKILNLKNKIDATTENIYDEIEEVLEKSITDPDEKKLIPGFMEKMKLEDPFRIITKEEGMFSKSYAWNFLSNTSSSKAINNLQNAISLSIKKQWKEAWAEIKEFLERGVALISMGSPKTIREIQGYFASGTAKGFWQLYRDLWIATHVGMPFFTSAIETVRNLYLVATNQGGKNYETTDTNYFSVLFGNFLDEIEWPKEFKKMSGAEKTVAISEVILKGLLKPGHCWVKDIKEFWDSILSGKEKPIVDWSKTKEVKEIQKTNNISDSTMKKLEELIQNPTPQTYDSILNVLKNQKTPQPVTPVTPSDDDIKSFMISNGMSESDYNVIITSWKFYDIDKANKTAMIKCIKNPSGSVENIVGNSYKIVNVNGTWVWDIDKSQTFKP